MHNALGNFLHQPTVRQMLRVSDADLSEVGRRKAEEALDEIERVLASSVWSFRAHQLVQTTCNCGSLIARDKSFFEAEKILQCSNCGLFYTWDNLFDDVIEVKRRRLRLRVFREGTDPPDHLSRPIAILDDILRGATRFVQVGSFAD